MRKGATEGRLPSQRAGSGPNSVTSRTAASIWTGLHHGCAGATPEEERAEASISRVSGSAEQEVKPAEQETMVRKQRYRCGISDLPGSRFVSQGSSGRGAAGCSTTRPGEPAPGGVVWRDRLPRFAGGLERYLSAVGVTVEALRGGVVEGGGERGG